MKNRISLLFIILFIFIWGCKNDAMMLDKDNGFDNQIIKADFESKTGYSDHDLFFINPNFKSKIDWASIFRIGNDTIYVKVDLVDNVNVLLQDSVKLSLDNKIWVKGVKTQEVWNYSLLTFIPSVQSNADFFEGRIVTTFLSSKNTIIKRFHKSRLGLIARFPPKKETCIYAYVGDHLSSIYCSTGDGSYDEWLAGGTKDYTNTNKPGSSPSSGGGSKQQVINNYNNAIDDENLPDCMKAVLDSLKKISGNSVADILKKFTGEVPGFNLKFQSSFANEIGRVAWVNNEIKNNYITINLNSNIDVLKNATDLAVATTLLHESIHAYLVAWANSNDKESANLAYPQLFDKYLRLKNKLQNEMQHEIFAKDFISDIASSVEKFGKMKGYNYTSTFYQDLAWKGLDNTSAFQKLDLLSQTRILNIIKSEQYGISKDNITQKGSKLGC